MTSASGRSIAGGSPFSLYQPTFSKSGIGRSFIRHPRPEKAPKAERPGHPETLAPPSSTHPRRPRFRRPPRFKPGRRDRYIPPLVHKSQYELPWRVERQKQQSLRAPFAYSSWGSEYEETRVYYHQPPAPSPETSTYTHRAEEMEGYYDHRRRSRGSPDEGVRFPERRPLHTQYTMQERWRDMAYKDAEPEWNRHRGPTPFAHEYPRYPYDYDYPQQQHTAYQPRWYPPFRDSPFTPPHDYYDHAPPVDPPRPTNNRWSFSSDSSTASYGSGLRWSPSSPTLYTFPTSGPYRTSSHEPDVHRVRPETEPRWGRHSEVRDIQGWVVEDLSAMSYTANRDPSADEVESSAALETSSREDEEMGQTVVYSNREAIRRDTRFTSPHERTRNLGGITVLEYAREENRRTLVTAPSVEQSTLERQDETRRRKRVYAFPMWAESPPRDMRGQRREGIRYRFRHSEEDVSSIPNGRQERPVQSAGLHPTPLRRNLPSHCELVKSVSRRNPESVDR